MIHLLDLVGTAVFAIAGALAGGRKKMDMFGVVVVALATALGGGTIRDAVLGARPVYWVTDPNYVIVGSLAALVTFAAARFVLLPGSIMLIADAFGLAIFTVIGAHRSLAFGTGALVAVIMGMMTGVAGGILRDLLSGEIPLVLRKEIYAVASLIGGAIYAALNALGMADPAAMTSAVVVTLGVRLAAIHWNLSLPVFAQAGGEIEGE
jgi:uncharacterized membrane protein YeiH